MSRIWCILPALFLTACTSDSDVVQVGNLLYRSLVGGAEKIPRERASAIPYASMGVELGSGPQALVVLGTSMAGRLEWFAGEDVYLATQQGRVTRTVGLPYDLGGLRTTPAVASDRADGTPAPTRYALDLPDLGVFGAPAQCSRRFIGDDEVEIFGARIPTRHIVEHCQVPALRWTFDNDFWEDRMSGYVWRSRQHIHPDSPPLTLEVFRPEQDN